MQSTFALLLLVASTLAAPAASDCTGTISSMGDVDAAVKCTTVNINSFTVPAGQGLTLNLLDATTVNLNGDLKFGNVSWAGPLFTVSGKSITFNGNGHTLDGGGPFYWDGLGGNGGVVKPAPMIKIKISGTYKNVRVLNSPARVYSVSNPAPLTMTGLTIDNSFGDLPNSKSGGIAAGHNTDGFDASTHDLTISNSVIMNQDDCLAINKGTNIAFTGNTCSGGHGISVGSIDSDATVNNITISNNKIINNDQALRIKTKSAATGSTVSGITYSVRFQSPSSPFLVCHTNLPPQGQYWHRDKEIRCHHRSELSGHPRHARYWCEALWRQLYRYHQHHLGRQRRETRGGQLWFRIMYRVMELGQPQSDRRLSRANHQLQRHHWVHPVSASASSWKWRRNASKTIIEHHVMSLLCPYLAI
ncbi:hypothetical protein HGRIS_002820 [Hohenbuehelia grisea]|uniref:endo-polygalacturonase n=1 Tax=Hohenbuehelia grisea TaxID=104357 RepID=A0ABR3JNS0_9AGAR